MTLIRPIFKFVHVMYGCYGSVGSFFWTWCTYIWVLHGIYDTAKGWNKAVARIFVQGVWNDFPLPFAFPPLLPPSFTPSSLPLPSPLPPNPAKGSAELPQRGSGRQRILTHLRLRLSKRIPWQHLSPHFGGGLSPSLLYGPGVEYRLQWDDRRDVR